MGPGNIHLGTPTCADDVLLAASSGAEIQQMMDTAQQYADSHQDILNPSKTTLTYFNTSPSPLSKITLKNNTVAPSSSFQHLGLLRSSSGVQLLISDRISVARRTVYALMPVGLHGDNRLSPAVAQKLSYSDYCMI